MTQLIVNKDIGLNKRMEQKIRKNKHLINKEIIWHNLLL